MQRERNAKLSTYSIQTFGCQMNYSDSERMAAYLDGLGLICTDNIEETDLLILNTCSVKQKAEDKVNGFVNNIRLKSKKKDLVIVLTGCIARRVWNDNKKVTNSFQRSHEERVKELEKIFPKVDIFIETKDFVSLGEKLGITIKYHDKPEHYLSFKPKYKNKFQAFVPISTGCNHFCTFCIVPYSRGKEVCRPAEEIIREVFELIRNGYKDITLLGQTVNRWINPDLKAEFEYDEAQTKIKGLNKERLNNIEIKKWKVFFEDKSRNENLENIKNIDLKMPRDFLQLIQVIDQIPGEWWTTWLSSHPSYITDELIDFMGKSVKEGHQRPYLHFALQSGSDSQLKRMNRRHSFEEFYSIVKKINSKVENLNLSTDIIVGFIGESEEDFQNTLNAQKVCNFDMIYISEYSPRIGTAAERLKETVPNEIKSQRKDELNDLLRGMARKKNQKFLNSTQKVLVDGLDRKGKYLTGKTKHNKEVRILESKDKKLTGEFINVKINKTEAWWIEGDII